MTTLETLENCRQRPHSLSHGDGVIPQKIQRQAEFTSDWSIPATHGSPNTILKMKQSPNIESTKLPHSTMLSIFQNLDRQCQERSSKIELDAKEALKTQFNAWMKSREKLYLAQLRDSSEQFRRTTLAAMKQRQAAEYSQTLADEKAKFADEYYSKLKAVQNEREQVVQRRLELVRQMEEAAALMGQCPKGEKQVTSEGLNGNNLEKMLDSQKTSDADTDERLNVRENEIKAAKNEARKAKEDLAAAIQSRDEALESLQNAKTLQEEAYLESKILKKQYENDKVVWKREVEAKEQKLHELETASHGARAEISSLQAELAAVQQKLSQGENVGKEQIYEIERRMLLERAEEAEAAAAAAELAKTELERCTAAAEAARTAAESQASHLRQRLEELIKENNALQRGMIAAEEAVRAASTAEKASAADRESLLTQVTETKQALATHRAAIRQLESQLKQERMHREKLEDIAKNASTLHNEAAAWKERTLRHAEDTRLRLAAALRDVEAVCLAARALGHSSSAFSSKTYTAPLLSTIRESEENAAEATVWLREAQIEGKALAAAAPGSSFSSSSFNADTILSS